MFKEGVQLGLQNFFMHRTRLFFLAVTVSYIIRLFTCFLLLSFSFGSFSGDFVGVRIFVG